MKILVGFLLAGIVVTSANAQQKVVGILSPVCDPLAIFTSKLDPKAFIERVKTCGLEDVQAAIDDANTEPVDNAALACLKPMQNIQKAVQKGGLITAFQAYRRARQSGVVTGCVNYVNSTLLLP